MPDRTDRFLIVSPMAIERTALAKALPRSMARDLSLSGPGAASVRHWAATVDAPPGSTVLVAGVAGALTPQARLGTAAFVHAIWTRGLASPRGASSVVRATHIPTDPLLSPVLASNTWRAAGSDQLISTPSEKASLATESGADVVDMESHAFAEEAARRGWRLIVVRGVSDSHDQALPPGIETLIDNRGHSRPLVVASYLARNPHRIGALRSLGRRTMDAMHSVASLIHPLVVRNMQR